MATNVYIAIPTADRFESCKATLESLSRCNNLDQITKVFVINNGSPLSGPEWRALQDAVHTKNVEYLQVMCRNKSLALNTALERISDPLAWIIFLDDDVTVSPHLIDEYLANIELEGRPERIYFGGGCRSDIRDEDIPEHLRPHLPLCIVGLDENTYARTLPEWFFLGFNWAVPCRALSEVGLFNPLFGPGSASQATGSETELQRRLYQAGYVPRFLPMAAVTHRIQQPGISLEWLLRRKFRNGVEHAQHILMTASTVRAMSASLKLMVLYLLAYMLCLTGRSDPTSRRCRRAFYGGVVHGVFFHWRGR